LYLRSAPWRASPRAATCGASPSPSTWGPGTDSMKLHAGR
jgi:hypothetical protein